MKSPTSETPPRFLALLRVLSVACLLLMSPAVATAQDCVVTFEPVEKEVKPLLERIRKDPFHEGLTTYIDNLAKVGDELDRWIEKSNAHTKNVCEPYFRDLRAFESEVESYKGRCPSVISDVNLYNQCRAEYDRLKPREEALNKRSADFQASEAALNEEGAKIPERARAAVEPAREILDETNTDKAFWLLAQTKAQGVRRDETDDCRAMADLFDALVVKVGPDPDQIARHSGAVLANGVRFPVPRTGLTVTIVEPSGYHMTFGQSGFRAQYQDDDPTSRNQVRHFVGYLVLGLKYSTATTYYAEVVAALRDSGQPADVSLGVTAANLGKSLADQPGLLRGIGGSIRGTICQ